METVSSHQTHVRSHVGSPVVFGILTTHMNALDAKEKYEAFRAS